MVLIVGPDGRLLSRVVAMTEAEAYNAYMAHRRDCDACLTRQKCAAGYELHDQWRRAADQEAVPA